MMLFAGTLISLMLMGPFGGFIHDDDPSVTPLPNESSLLLEAEKHQRPSQSDPDRNFSAQSPVNKNSEQANEECDGPIEDCADIDFDAYAEYTAEEVTVGDIIEAVRQVGLPSLQIKIQPGGTTLVNFETIFYADAPTFERTVDLLGYAVDLRATPASFTWHHGDGTSQTTSSPGHKYPNHDVTHTFKRAADNIRPSVDVTYQVSYRIDSNTWETLPGAITAPGAAASLSVEQGLPLLTKP